MKGLDGEDVVVIEHHVLLGIGKGDERVTLSITGEKGGTLYRATLIEHRKRGGMRCACDTSHLAIIHADFEKVILTSIDEHFKVCKKKRYRRHLRLVTT